MSRHLFCTFNRLECTKQVFERIREIKPTYKKYARKNMGCGKRMSSGISWAFEETDSFTFSPFIKIGGGQHGNVHGSNMIMIYWTGKNRGLFHI